MFALAAIAVGFASIFAQWFRGASYEEVLFYGVWSIGGAAAAVAAFRFSTLSPTVVFALAICWVAFLNVDFLVLGRGARLEWGDGNELFWTYFPYLAANRGAGFLHLLAGGVDPLSFGRMGGEYFSWRVWLSGVAPLWVVAIVLRFVVPLVAFFGVYRLLRDVGKCDRSIAMACALLYAVAYDVTSAMTFLYGLSHAAFPLLLWAFWRAKLSVGWLLAFCGLGVVYATSSDPFYCLPTLWAVAAALWIVVRPAQAGACLLGLCVVSVVWLANFAETTYAILQFVPHSARAATSVEDSFFNGLLSRLRWTFWPSVGFNQGGWPMFTTLALAAVVALRTRSTLAAAFVALVGLGVATALLRAMPFAAVGLGFLETYSWYIEYGAFSLGAFVLGLALKALIGREVRPNAMRLRHALLCGFVVGLAFAMSSIIRVSTYLDMFHRGGIARASEIPNLVKADWYAGPLWRAISVGEQPYANTPSNHGIATYDGAATFVSRRLNRYWEAGILKGAVELHSLEVRLNQDWEHWTLGAPQLLADRVDIDFLRIANVRYVLSAAPLADAALRKISGPASDDVFETRPSKREKAWILDPKWRAWLREPPPVYVYEIDGALPRAFVARSIECVPDDLSATAFARVRSVALAGGALVDCAAVPVAVGQVRDVKTIRLTPIGFEIELAPAATDAAAALVLNTPFLPFWKAFADGAEIAVQPANIAQLVVAVPAWATKVELVYRPKRLLGQAP